MGWTCEGSFFLAVLREAGTYGCGTRHRRWRCHSRRICQYAEHPFLGIGGGRLSLVLAEECFLNPDRPVVLVMALSIPYGGDVELFGVALPELNRSPVSERSTEKHGVRVVGGVRQSCLLWL